MSVRPGKHNFEAIQGQEFNQRLTFKDSEGNIVDLTGWTARFVVRREPSDANPITEITSAAGSGITLGADTEGHIQLVIEASETATLDVESYDYALIFNDGERTYTAMQGLFTIRENVGR